MEVDEQHKEADGSLPQRNLDSVFAAITSGETAEPQHKPETKFDGEARSPRGSSSGSEEEGATVWCGPSAQELLAASKDPRAKLRLLGLAYSALPAIYRRRDPAAPDLMQQLGVRVADWREVRRIRRGSTKRHTPDGALDLRPLEMSLASRQSVQKVAKVAKVKGQVSGRTYTSKYRGVHQTFPTKRWEAQFRRSGKPTSLGCFDHEEEAARAYDKMMLWCELHTSTGVKGGITNFDPTEYEKELAWLQSVSQDELVQQLRGEGRRQAAQRMLRVKRDGQVVYTGPGGAEKRSAERAASDSPEKSQH